MAMNGETIHLGAAAYCDECGAALVNEVLSSGNGSYYIGTTCCSGPYSRESGYYSTREVPEALLEADAWQRREAGFAPTAVDVYTFKVTIEGFIANGGADGQIHSLFTVTQQRALEILNTLHEEHSQRGGA